MTWPLAGPLAFVYSAGYWFAVMVVLGGLAVTILALGYLAYKARLARDRYAVEARQLKGRDPRGEADAAVTEYNRLRMATEAELRQAGERLQGMREAFEKGIKG